MERLGNDLLPGLGAAAREEESAAGGLALLVDELAHGVLVTDLAGRVQHANQAARQELGRQRHLGQRGRSLQACAPDDQRLLLDALARAADGKRGLVTLGAGSPEALTLAVLPLRADGALAPAGVAWLFARASVCDSHMLCFFARSHGLTVAEEQVLNVLCQGYSAPEAAVQLKVAVSTVRSHVRSLCAKTRSSGVRELINRVAVLPPLAPALPQELVH